MAICNLEFENEDFLMNTDDYKQYDDYNRCNKYIIDNFEGQFKDTLLELSEWLYRLHLIYPQAKGVHSYITTKDLRFHFEKRGRGRGNADHFLCILPNTREKCAELHVYGEDGKKSDFCKEKVQLDNPTSPFCIIDSEQVNSMSLQMIKEEVFRSYQARLGKKYDIQVDRASAFPIKNVTSASPVNVSQKCYQPTIQDAEAALDMLAPNGEEIPTSHIRDYIQLDANKKGIALCDGWWDILKNQLL